MQSVWKVSEHFNMFLMGWHINFELSPNLLQYNYVMVYLGDENGSPYFEKGVKGVIFNVFLNINPYMT